MMQDITRMKNKFNLTIIIGAEKYFSSIQNTFLIPREKTITIERNYFNIVEGTYDNLPFPIICVSNFSV